MKKDILYIYIATKIWHGTPCPYDYMFMLPGARCKRTWRIISKITLYSAGLMAASFILLFLFACVGPREGKESLNLTAAPQEEKTLSGWEGEWRITLEKARKERIVVVSSNLGPQVRAPLGENFEKKFGIKVEWIAARGAEMVERVLRERRAGIYSYDLYTSGFSPVQAVLKPAGAIQPLEPLLLLPEVKDPSKWFQNRLPWADRDKTTIIFWLDSNPNITINTNLVKRDEIKSYQDLLEPKWKGKIVMDDPTVAGSANNWATTIGNFFPTLGWDFQRKLAGQVALLTRDRRLQFQWVAQGKYSITLPNISVGQEMKGEGAPLDFIITREGLFAASSNAHLAYYDKAPHPNAAKVFANWLLTREAQEIAAIANGSESTRIDVSTSHLPPGWSREEVIRATGTLVRPEPEVHEKFRVESMPTILEIWGPLLK